MSAHNYELMFIADPEMDDNGLKKLTDQHMEIVTKEGGSVDNIDIWGRRKLAYEIDGKTEEEIQIAENFLKMSGASKIVRTSAYNHEGIQELIDLIENIDLSDY